MAITADKEAGNYNTTINVVPLVDIMLVLLIIFIITLPVMTHSVRIDLPRATNDPPPAHPAKPINIAVAYNGAVSWDGVSLPAMEMISKIKESAALDPQPEVLLQIDRRARYDFAANVLFAVQRGGLKKIGFVADASGNL
ncbi:MAG: biopolymer transporter ExbD [Pseudomonadota bacterium]|jgi:biopolymer transport protein ExbD